MKNPIAEAQEQVREVLLSAIGRCVAAGTLPPEPIPAFSVEIPADPKNGDFATNAAMVSARAFRMAPRKIAEAIEAELVLAGTYFERAEIAGPGFINFFLGKEWYCAVLRAIDENGENYGRTNFGSGKKVLVEFVSANPTGPMHIGNARGGAIGDSLASALDWAGYEVKREFYVNDAGNQINKFGMSLSLRYLQLYKEGIEMPEDAYQGEDIIAHAKAFAGLHGDEYVNAVEADRRAALVAYALPLNIEGLKRDLLKYRIEYDNWFKESTLHENGEVDKIIALFKEKGCTYESEGALWFKATDYGADQDFVLVRSNGVPTYVVPDIAYHYNKLVTRGFDKAIDVLGADHHGYVPRLKAALTALGVDAGRLDALLMQMVRLVRGGEIIKASKRSGKAITLVTLYYVQYAHARICSIRRTLAQENIIPAKTSECNLSVLCTEEEKALVRFLAKLPQEIIEAAKDYDPARLTRYAVDLATMFHKFYNACRVRCDDKTLMNARFALCMAVKQALSNVLSLLKITAPDAM